MAKARRKRRRPKAGPPPAASPRRAAQTTSGRAPAPKRRPGEPIPPSFRGVLLRSLIVALVFYPLLVYVVGETSSGAALVSAVAFLLMVPFGLLLDRMRYRIQMRRFTREQARRSPS